MVPVFKEEALRRAGGIIKAVRSFGLWFDSARFSGRIAESELNQKTL